jgi:hypothetical protein
MRGHSARRTRNGMGLEASEKTVYPTLPTGAASDQGVRYSPGGAKGTLGGRGTGSRAAGPVPAERDDAESGLAELYAPIVDKYLT